MYSNVEYNIKMYKKRVGVDTLYYKCQICTQVMYIILSQLLAQYFGMRKLNLQCFKRSVIVIQNSIANIKLSLDH